jgi:CheY-like chemotaxis protein
MVTKVSVLVADDDAAIRRMQLEILSLEGYPVVTAEHGGPALDRMRASSVPLLVLLGLNMPGVDGEAVLQAVAADPALAARHRIILNTGDTKRATTGSVAQLRQQLDVPLLPRPFTMDQLLDAVAQAAAGMP